MTSELVVSTPEPSTAATAAALEKLLAFAPKEPEAPISEGQITLMKRFELKVRKGMTKGQANEAIGRFLKRNPAVAVAYLEERAQRRRESWEAKKLEYLAIAKARSNETNRLPAHPNQIGAVMAAAFVRKDVSRGQQLEARSMLQWGAGAAMTSTFLDTLPKQDRVPAGAVN